MVDEFTHASLCSAGGAADTIDCDVDAKLVWKLALCRSDTCEGFLYLFREHHIFLGWFPQVLYKYF